MDERDLGYAPYRDERDKEFASSSIPYRRDKREQGYAPTSTTFRRDDR
jgi:hypothetical protein